MFPIGSHLHWLAAIRIAPLCIAWLLASPLSASAQGADGLAPPPHAPAPEPPTADAPPAPEASESDEPPEPAAPAPEAPAAPAAPAPEAPPPVVLPPAVAPPPGVHPAPAAPIPAATAAPTEAPDEFDDEFDAEPPPEGVLRTLVIDAAPYGVDPVVGEHVSAQLRETAAAMGYEVASRDESVAAARAARMPYPPSPADLWRVTWAGRAQRGVFSRVWAEDGRYVVELTVASMDGTGPFFARGTSGAEDLHPVVDGLLRQALPAPERWDADAAARYAAGATARPGASGPSPSLTPSPVFAPASGGVQLRPQRRRSRIPSRRFDLAFAAEGAVSTTSDHFYNQLIGARLDFRVTTSIALGAYVGYANLRGRDGRAQNVLFYLMGEDRIHLSDRLDLTLPLRFALGYLPFNGPFVRLSAGLNLAISDRLEVGVDLIAPTFWVIPGDVAATADFSLELIYRL